MSNHNQHNENTPDKPHADASHLSEEQQSLLTADTLGQLEPGSSEAIEAAEIRTGQHRAEADKLAADTAQVAEAIQQIAAEETASLADDPARKEVRQAVLAAIAKNGSVSPASSTDTAGQHKKSNRRIVGWLFRTGKSCCCHWGHCCDAARHTSAKGNRASARVNREKDG